MSRITAQISENETGVFIADVGFATSRLVPDDPRFEVRTEVDSNGIEVYRLYLKPGVSLDFETEPTVTVNFPLGDLGPLTTVSITVSDSRDMTLRGAYQVTSFEPDFGQPTTQTSIAALKDGGYVLVWTTNGGGVSAQRFDANGETVGARVEVDVTTPNPFEPSVAVLESGDFVVSWQSWDFTTGERDVFARQFGPEGDAVMDTIALSFEPEGLQGEPVAAGLITPLENGGYVVAWTSEHKMPGVFNVFSVRFDKDGTRLDGTETQISTGFGRRPDIESLTDGGYVITWESDGGSIYSRSYSDTGQPESEAVELAGEQGFEPSVTTFTDGSYIVAWSTYTSVMARIVGADGEITSEPLTLMSRITDDRVGSGEVTLAALDDGSGFVAVVRGGDGSFLSRYFDMDGSPRGPALAVGAVNRNEDNPAVTVLPDGSVIISERGDNAIDFIKLGVPENVIGAVVGELTPMDEIDLAVTYGVDDNRFEVVGGQLKLKDNISLDYEAETEVRVTVTAFESDGDTYSETFVLPVLDQEDTLDTILAEILEDSASSGGANNANGVAVTDDQLARIAIGVLAGDDTSSSPMEARYQAAIQAEYNFSNLPTTAEVQAIIDTVNADLSGLFDASFNESFVVDWDMSSITDMSGMFEGAVSFNQDIGGWDVRFVTNVNSMFADAASFDQDIGGWDMSSIVDMSGMFDGAVTFNQNIGVWNVSSAALLYATFRKASSFDQDIGGWETQSVVSMNALFEEAISFNQNIGAWDTSSVTDMAGMFRGATSFNLGIVNSINAGGLDSANRIFGENSSSGQDIGTWDVGGVVTMAGMFDGATSFDQDIGSWDISSLEHAEQMLDASGMSRNNYDRLLAGWATLDGTAGETTIQNGVTLGAQGLFFSDATSFNHLRQVYGWTIGGSLSSDVTVGDNSDEIRDESGRVSGQTLHMLDGDDIVTGSAHDDVIVGGAGNDTLTGGTGADTFVYKFFNAGNDTISDFVIGEDSIDVGQLLIGYEATVSELSDFVWVEAGVGGAARLVIDRDGLDGDSSTVTTTLADVDHRYVRVDDVVDGKLVLSLANRDPQVATLLQDQSFGEDSIVSFTLPLNAFVDADGDTLNLHATLASGSVLPNWLTFDAASGSFFGAPPRDYNGSLDIEVSASDGKPGSNPAKQTFTLEIYPVNDGPDIGAALNGVIALEGSQIEFTLSDDSFIDPDGDALTLSATLADGSDLPSWLIFDARTATFSGIPPSDAVGDLRVKVTAFDGEFTAGRFFDLSVQSQPLQPGDTVAEGGEFKVSSHVEGRQMDPAATTLSDGGFVVAWVSPNQDGSSTGIHAQRYDSAGQPVGGEFQVNSYTSLSQTDPSIAALADGGFVVTWESYYQDGDVEGIFAQRYDASGRPFGSEFQVNDYMHDRQANPSITALADGGFVIAWESFGQDGDNYGIFARQFEASGRPNAEHAEFRVNSSVFGRQADPTITALADDGFVVAWESKGHEGSYGIFAQCYDSAGFPNGDEFRVNSNMFLGLAAPSIAALVDGGFVVTWDSATDGTVHSIQAQRYDATGLPVGGEFQVNSAEYPHQIGSSVTALADGGFVVTWASHGQDVSGGSIQARCFDVTGQPVGDEFRVNSYTDNEQNSPDVTALADGGFVVTWMSWQDGSQYGIYAQRYAVDGTYVGGDILGTDDADTIFGGTADDVIEGGEGNDTIVGGAGADVFVYSTDTAGSDIILDFEGSEDVLDFSALIEGYDPTTSEISNWIMLTANADGSTRVTVDHDGDGFGRMVTIDLDNVLFETLDSGTFMQNLLIW